VVEQKKSAEAEEVSVETHYAFPPTSTSNVKTELSGKSASRFTSSSSATSSRDTNMTDYSVANPVFQDDK
jgi:hypothetical protein